MSRGWSSRVAVAMAVLCALAPQAREGAVRADAPGTMSLLGVAAPGPLARPALALPGWLLPSAPVTLPTPPRPYDTLQPRMPPPAASLYVADVRALSRDEKILLFSLQGIVNRKQPRIYLVGSDDDTFWLSVLRAQGATGAPTPVADPLSLATTFRDEVRGAVVPDPKVYVSPLIAVELAGADDLLIATPELAARLGLPIVQDLRGRFADDAAAMRYSRTELLPRLNPYVSISIDPAILDSGAIDHIIAARGLAFWVTGPKAQGNPGASGAAERGELEALLAAMPLNAVVHGFWWHGDGVGLQEPDGVGLASSYGKLTTVSDYTANFSVFSGVTRATLKQKPRPAAPKLDPTKVYVAFTMSDGDNLCTWRGYFRRYFADPLRGTIPIGWGIAPSLIDCAPSMVRWYYEQATPNDEFLCDVSGAGYMYPSKWGTRLADREGAFASFYDWTRKYMERLDLRGLRLMDVSRADIERAGRELPGVKLLMPDYGYQGGWDYDGLTYSLSTGQSVFRAVTAGAGPDHLANQIRHHAGLNRPAFVNAFIWNWGSKLSDLKQVQEKLGPGYVFVTPSQLATLYGQRPPTTPAHVLVDNPIVNLVNWALGW